MTPSKINKNAFALLLSSWITLSGIGCLVCCIRSFVFICCSDWCAFQGLFISFCFPSTLTFSSFPNVMRIKLSNKAFTCMLQTFLSASLRYCPTFTSRNLMPFPVLRNVIGIDDGCESWTGVATVTGGAGLSKRLCFCCVSSCRYHDKQALQWPVYWLIWTWSIVGVVHQHTIRKLGGCCVVTIRSDWKY